MSRVFLGSESSVATGCKIDGMAFHDNYYTGEMNCELTTGEKYALANDLNHVDFLKIDVEGMDYRVLQGFGRSLKNIDVIQFEFGVFKYLLEISSTISISTLKKKTS